MYNLILLFLTISFLSACNAQNQEVKTHYLAHVGDTEFKSAFDDPKFELCNSDRVVQYYQFSRNLEHDSEKKNILKYFNTEYNNNDVKMENGYITIRFVVNCKGETGWFRVQQMDDLYKNKEFDESISQQIIDLTKKYNFKKQGGFVSEEYDYYKYLTFKIQEGKIIEILP